MISSRTHKGIIYALIISLLMTMFSVAQAVAPANIITYQGRVLNANAVPVADSSLSMKFLLYTLSSGGTCLWSNDSADCQSNTPASVVARSVTLTTGLFTENLGDTENSYAAIADSVFGDNTTVYLEVQIGAETLSPRRLITAAPYALNAQRLDGIDSTGFLASTGDTGTGIFDFTGATFSGGSPIVFEGASPDDFETTFAFVDPTLDRTITFQNASGTVAFTSDIPGASPWESGVNGIYEDDTNVIIGADASFTYATGSTGDLRVADQIEVLGDGFFDNNLVIGASTSSTETLSATGFSLGGDDLFVAGTAGIEGTVYTDAGFEAGATTTFGSGLITTTGSTDLLLTIAGGDLTFGQNTTIGGGNNTITINTSDWDISSTGTLTGIGGITMDEEFSLTGAGEVNMVITNTTASEEMIDLIVTAAGSDAMEINFTLADDGDDDALAALDIIVTSAMTGDLDVLRGINIANLNSADGNVAEQGLVIGSGWDVNLFFNDATTIIDVADEGVIRFREAGDTSTLMTLTDNSNVGDLMLTGDLAVNGDDITSDGAMRINATGRVTIGSGGSTPSVTGEDMLFVEGILEVDGSTILDSTLTVASTSTFIGAASFDAGANPANAGIELLGTTSLEWDGLYVGDDGVGITHGADQDFVTSYNSTDLLLSFGTAAGASANIDYAIFTFAVETDNGTVTANQEVFEIGRQGADNSDANWVELLALDEDGDLTIAGSATVASLICDDCLDFSEFSDSMSLDASTTITLSGNENLSFINSGTGNIIFNLTSTGDFDIQDGGNSRLSVNDSGTTTIAQNATSDALFLNQDGNGITLNIDSESTSVDVINLDAATTTGIVLDINAASLTSGRAFDLNVTNTHTLNAVVQPIVFSLTNAQTSVATTDYTGIAIAFNNNPTIAGNTETVMSITNIPTANTIDNETRTLLELQNSDNDTSGLTIVRDALLITNSGGIASGIVDAVDASDSTIDNALNAGSNFILFIDTRVYGSDSGTITWEDTSGNDLMTLTDNANVGDLVVTGNFTADNLSCTAGDCLDFDDFSDTMSLDASTTIAFSGNQALTFNNAGTGNFIIDLQDTGDFDVLDNGSVRFSVNDSGTTTIAQNSTNNALFVNQDGNGIAINIDSEATSATTVEIQINNTSGVILAIAHHTTTTLTGRTTGVNIDFDTNTTGGSGADTSAFRTVLPNLTASGATSTSIIGYQVDQSGALDTANNADVTTIDWAGLYIDLPNLDTGHANDTVRSYGIEIVAGTVADGPGTEDEIGISLGGTKIDFDLDNDTSLRAGLDDELDVELGGNVEYRFTASAFQPVPADVNTLGTAEGEWSVLFLGNSATALQFGLEQDASIGVDTTNDALEIILDGVDVGFVSIGQAANEDHMTASDGDLLVTDELEVNGAVYFDSTLLFTPVTTGTFVDFDLKPGWTTGDLMNVDFGSATTATGAATLLDIDLTNFTADGSPTDALYGIRLNDPSSNTASTEYGLYIQGTNWDRGIYSEDDVEIREDLIIDSSTAGVDMVFGSDNSTPISIGADVFAGGTIMRIGYDTAETISTSDLIGLSINLNTNVTADSDQDVEGVNVQLPGFSGNLPNAAETTNLTGYQITGAGLDTGAGAAAVIVNWRGMVVNLPDIDTGSANDVVTSTGILFSAGNISPGAGTEEQIGIDLAGTKVDLDEDNDTSFEITADDQLDWEFGGQAQMLIMRAPQAISAAASANVPIFDLDLSTPADTTGTNIHSGINIDVNVGNASGGTNTISGLSFDPIIGNAQVGALTAIFIGALTGTASTGEYALQIDSGWDREINFSSDNVDIGFGNNGNITFRDATEGNANFVIQDTNDSATNHSFLIDSNTALEFDSNADSDVDITTALNEILRILPSGTGDVVFQIDADSNVQLQSSAAPTFDMLVIDNMSNATITTDVSAIDVSHSASNASGAAVNIVPAFAGGSENGLVYRGLQIASFSSSNDAGVDTVIGIDIQPITDPGGTIDSHGLEIGGSWDSNIFYNDTTTVLTVSNGGTITWQDSEGHGLMQLADSGTTGTLTINNIISSASTELDLTAGDGVAAAGGAIDINAGIGAGANAGGNVTINAGVGGATGNGGEVVLVAANGGATSGAGGNVRLHAGSGTGGLTHGNIGITAGGTPTALSLSAGDIGFSAKDDIIMSSDDDINFDVTSAGAVINIGDNAVTKTIDIGGVNNNSADTINIATNATSVDTITIGNTSANIAITDNVWSITSAGIITATFNAAGTSALCWDNAGASEITDCSGDPVADYAERYPAAANVEYGHIVVPGDKIVYTDDEFNGVQEIRQVVLSSYAYQGPVIGIASNNWGDFTSAGNNVDEADNPVPIALTGRLPVKVVAENGAIEVGDFLTTSSTPGHAMRATKMGRVIGMALEDWNGEDDDVMVQVINTWYMGDVIDEDGTSTISTNNVIVSERATATEDEQTFDSYGLSLMGSAWNGSEAEVVEMMMQNVVDDANNYRLSISNGAETEVAYITNEGTMRIAGDMIIAGNLYPSDRGEAQTEKYIYYDGSDGPAGDFMRTNAKGWSTGSYDFAEMFPSTEELKPGDVVMFAGDEQYVRRTTSANETALAGIVSTRPGFLAGENVKGAYPIALAGRVPARVTLEGGEISVGDPLTSSSVSGAAMKAEESGSIIGYALERYNGSGDDKILVYVNVGYWGGGVTTTTPGTTSNASGFASGGTTNFTALNMSGSIAMNSNSITNIGSLSGLGGSWSIASDGTILTEGLIKTEITTLTNKKVETIAVTSPEAIITLSGTAELVNGEVEVRFEQVAPDFNDVININEPIRVIVTPSGPVSLYVSEKDQNHFVVKRFAGDADVEFDWIVTAYRKDFGPAEIDEGDIGEDVEVEVVEEEIEDVAEETSSDDAEEVTVEEVEIEEEVAADEVIEEEAEPVAQEEPASPESSELNEVDEASEDDGGALAETPSESTAEANS